MQSGYCQVLRQGICKLKFATINFILRYYKGCAVHVHSVSNIKSGGTISENYGPIYSQHPMDDRKSTLKDQYWFDCNCKCCIENWPLYDGMKTDEIRFRCDGDNPCNNIITIPSDCNEFMIKCIQCGQFTNILKGLKAIQVNNRFSGADNKP